MHRALSQNVQTRMCYNVTKLGAQFNIIKDPIKKFHKDNTKYLIELN